MTIQLTKAQIEAIRVELARYGLAVKAKAPRAKSNSFVARIKAWKPETPAGRACKSSMLRHAAWGPFKGASNYQVKGQDGQWHAEDSPGFDAAKAYRKALDGDPRKPDDFDLYPGWYEGIGSDKRSIDA